jgi:TRAP-type mannitol/chloroaromatic compound transport system permease small subunit
MVDELHAEGGGGPVFRAAAADGSPVLLCRAFAWCNVAALFAFLGNNYLNFWRGWPGATAVLSGSPLPAGMAAYGWSQIAIYLVAIVVAIGFVVRTPARPLRRDALTIYAISTYIVRAAFWAVLFIGLADAVLSFLRVEGFLPQLIGQKLTVDLGRPSFRGLWIHFPAGVLGMIVAIFYRGLGFPWLGLLVVAAELLIVISRFVFSYEQAFMGDLVRFWYAALFLFASAYTLLEDGHVRVDVVYAAFSDRTKGLVNAVGSVLLGISLCWVILVFGLGSRATVINGPLLSFEVTQTGFGMYVKYWMAGFLAIFAITMLLEFSGYFLEGMADYRGDPDKRRLDIESADARQEI